MTISTALVTLFGAFLAAGVGTTASLTTSCRERNPVTNALAPGTDYDRQIDDHAAGTRPCRGRD